MEEVPWEGGQDQARAREAIALPGGKRIAREREKLKDLALIRAHAASVAALPALTCPLGRAVFLRTSPTPS
jgi:hypothetical protein